MCYPCCCRCYCYCCRCRCHFCWCGCSFTTVLSCLCAYQRFPPPPFCDVALCSRYLIIVLNRFHFSDWNGHTPRKILVCISSTGWHANCPVTYEEKHQNFGPNWPTYCFIPYLHFVVHSFVLPLSGTQFSWFVSVFVRVHVRLHAHAHTLP